MATGNLARFVELLSQSLILESDQQDELPTLQTRFKEPKELAHELIRRQWFTAFQLTQISQGKGQQLTLGQYVLLEHLGEGGMGQVFKARQKNLHRIVALKLIRKEMIDNPRALQRFQREMRAAGFLSHPNIVHAYDANHEGDTAYMVMEYIDGIDLGKLVKKVGPLPVVQACDFIRQAALGLQHAHERHMVHRDIKPANLLVTPSPLDKKKPKPTPRLGQGPVEPWGQIKILDMGLARWHDPETGESVTQLTQHNTIVGTPEFIAPEQARNSHNTDIRADLYSLGCTFYYLLAGRAPFPEGSLTEKLLKHQFDEPTPIEEARRERLGTDAMPESLNVPAEVAAVVRKLMQKKPEDRLQTPGELAVILEELVGRLQTPGAGTEGTQASLLLQKGPEERTADFAKPSILARVRPRWMTRRVLIYIVVAFFTLGVLARLRQNHDTLPPLDASLLPPPRKVEETPWQTLVEKVDRAHQKKQALNAIEVDNQLDERDKREKKAELFLELVKHRFFDDLRQELVWQRLETPAKVAPQDVAKAFSKLPSPLDFADGGTVEKKNEAVKAVLHDVVAMFPPKMKLIPPPKPAQAVAFSPDGRWLVGAGDDATIRVWDITHELFPQTFPTAIYPKQDKINRLLFNPNGKTFASAGNDGSVKVYDIHNRKAVFTVDTGPRPVHALAFSPDGSQLAAAAESHIYLWDMRELSEIRRFDGQIGPLHGLAFSPDRRKLFFTGEKEIRWANADQGTSSNLMTTPLPAPARGLAISPDGKTLVVSLMTEGLAWFAWDGYNLLPRAAAKEPNDLFHQAEFTPDGAWLVTVGNDKHTRLWNPDSGKAIRSSFHPWVSTRVSVAPDGRHVATANVLGTITIVRLPD